MNKSLMGFNPPVATA